MKRQIIKKTTKNPIDEAIRLLVKWTGQADEDRFRQWVMKTLDDASKGAEKDQLIRESDALQRDLCNKARDLLQSVKEVRESVNRPFGLHLPVEDMDRFEKELQGIVDWQNKPRVYLHLGGIFIPQKPPKTNRPLPSAVLLIHAEARQMLVECGIIPTQQPGGNLAKLGSLLCSAAGYHLPDGESIDKVRDVCTPKRLLKE